MTFGERVKQARLANGLTQGEVAIAAGFRDKSAICEIEKQRAFNATAEKIINLCKALNTDPNTLLEWEKTKKTFKVKVRRIKTHERSNSI